MRFVLRVLRRIWNHSPRYAPYLLAFGVFVMAVWTVWLSMVFPPDFVYPLTESNQWLARLSPLLVAATFWLPGLVVLAYARPDRQASTFFLFCQGIALILISGTQSAMGYSIGMIIFRVVLWWIGPLTVHTQMALTAPEQMRLNRRVLWILYSCGLLLFITYSVGQGTQRGLAFVYGRQLAYGWLALCIALSFLLLARRYYLTTDLEIQRRTRILLRSNLLGFSPVLLTSLLPDILWGQYWLPYEASFLFLMIIPAGYSYAILRYRLVDLQRYVDRSAAYSLIVLAVAGVYGTCYLAFSRLLPNVERLPLLVEMSLAVSLIFAVQPLYRWLQRQVNRWFYGSWYDDRAALMRISQSLGEAPGDSANIAGTLCQVLEKAISLDYARLMLRNGAIVTGKGFVPSDQVPHARAEQILNELHEETGQELGRGQDLEKLVNLTVFERGQIFGDKPRLWLLLSGSQGPLGLLVLGPRRGGDFDPDALETLELLARQTKTALENAALLAQVRTDSAQITRLHRQLIQAREAERSGLARELHDETLQSLYGMNYQIAELKPRLRKEEQVELDRLRAEVTRLLDEVRSLCADLRPPALDSLGIVAAAHAHIRKVRKMAGLHISFRLQGNENQEIPDEVAMTLYRVLQESLSNVVKHAKANKVQVSLDLFADHVRLCIMDNGQGFTAPRQFASFTRHGHFGLAGIQERVELIGGGLDVETAPDQGCKICIQIPLSHLTPTIPRQTEGLNAYSNLDRR